MDRKITGFFAILCALLLVSGLLFAAVRIGGEIRENRLRARVEFAEIAKIIQGAINPSWEDEIFRQNIRDTFFKTPTIVAILVEGEDGPHLALEKSTGFLDYSEGYPRFTQGMALDGISLRAPLPRARDEGTHLRALALRYDPLVMANIFKQALYILFSGVLVALVLLFVGIANKGKTKREEADSARVEAAPLDEHIPSLSADFSFNDSQDMSPLAMPIRGQESPGDLKEAPTEKEDPQNSAFDQIQTIEEAPRNDNGPDGFEEPPREESEGPAHGAEFPFEAPASKADGSPSGLYNSESGIGWESYLMERLGAELHRSASFEQDLVLILVDNQHGGDRHTRAALAERAVKFFSFRDLTFEYGSNGLAVILPNMDLEHGLRMAEEFLQRLRKTSQGDQFFKDEAFICCGVASRHGRLLDAERILSEALGALQKAREDEKTPVIAFRSDPERYREFLKKA